MRYEVKPFYYIKRKLASVFDLELKMASDLVINSILGLSEHITMTSLEHYKSREVRHFLKFCVTIKCCIPF